MKKVLVMVASVAIFAALAIPAFAQYDVNWSDDFNNVNSGAVGTVSGGTNGWIQPTGTGATITTSPKYSLAPSGDGKVITENGDLSYRKSILQQGKSGIVRSVKPLQVGGGSYYTAVFRAWVYDPYPTTTAGALVNNNIDTRVGMYSNNSAANMNAGAMSYAVAAGLTDTRGPYWTAYASSGFAVMNGTGTGVGYSFIAGYTLTTANCAPAPRKQGWNSIIIGFNSDPVAKTLGVDWYINLDYENPQLNARLDASTTSGRGLNIESIAGLYLGSAGVNGMGTWIDDVSFSGMGTPVPEPSSMLALGTGLIGLAGLIRRKR